MGPALRQRVAEAAGAAVERVTPLSGGCVGDVGLARLSGGGRVVVKTDASRDARLDVEAAMLRRLADASDLPVPGVLLGDPDLLVMEHVEADGRGGADAERHAADLLASLHGVGPDNGLFGLDFDTLIGGLPQRNPPTAGWSEFFGRHRLMEMARQAHEAGRLPGGTRARVDRLAARLDRWIAEPAAGPSLVHGDVWGGNVLCHAGRVAAFIDPAIYFADPEIELAFTTLFGTFGEAFFARYAERRGLAEGFFEQRRDLYNLYPLLVHVRLFGGGYLAQVENTLRRFGV
jgi:fructosamine-3-kinase